MPSTAKSPWSRPRNQTSKASSRTAWNSRNPIFWRPHFGQRAHWRPLSRNEQLCSRANRPSPIRSAWHKLISQIPRGLRTVHRYWGGFLLRRSPDKYRTAGWRFRCQYNWRCACVLAFSEFEFRSKMIRRFLALTLSLWMASLSMPVQREMKFKRLTTNSWKFFRLMAVMTSPLDPWPILCPSFHRISWP